MRTVTRYSDAFKFQVILALEEGRYSCPDAAARAFGIGGTGTVSRWVRQHGKERLLKKVIRVELPDERSRLEALTKELRQVKLALADSHVALVVLQAEYQVMCEAHGVTDVAEFKKKLGMKPPRQG